MTMRLWALLGAVIAVTVLARLLGLDEELRRVSNALIVTAGVAWLIRYALSDKDGTP